VRNLLQAGTISITETAQDASTSAGGRAAARAA
jgi:hypothetical protein